MPLMPVGRLVLNRNPDNFFAETEQVAFCTAHVVPGIDFSHDPLLAGRIHSVRRHADPRLAVRTSTRSRSMRPWRGAQQPARWHARKPSTAVASPTSRTRWPGDVRFKRRQRIRLVRRQDGAEASKLRGKPERFAEHYAQARLFLDSQTPPERAHIINAFRFELSRVQTPAVRERMVSGLMNVDREFAEAVATGLGMPTMPAPMPKGASRRT